MRRLLGTALGFALAACTGEAGENETATTGASTSGATTSASGGASTGDASDTAGACEPTTVSVRASVFDPRCAQMGCHDPNATAGGLNLGADDLLAELVGVGSGTCDGKIRIVPGDPDASYLYQKVAGTPDCGVQMPIGGMLDDAEVQCIADWISSLESGCETCGGDVCVDLQGDAQNCGSCGYACPTGVACVDGACACGAGTEDCDGACVDTLSDPQHCGGCGIACPGGEVCFAGVCASDCGMLTECNGACVNLDQDPLHCGSCDTTCAQGEGCSGGSCGCEGNALTYAADLEGMFVSRCTAMGCHSQIGPMPPAGDMNLTMGMGYGDLVGVPSAQCNGRLRVEAGKPSASYVVDKLKGINLCFGTKMPKTGPGLSQAQIADIEGWICGGAPP